MRPHDVPVGCRIVMRQIVCEVRCIPDHNIGIRDRLTVQPTIDIGLVRRTNGNGTIVYFGTVVTQYPDVSSSKGASGICDATPSSTRGTMS